MTRAPVRHAPLAQHARPPRRGPPEGRPDHLVWRRDSRPRAAARRMATGRRAVIVGELRTMAIHELRDKARLGIAYAQAGTPVMIFQHGDPSAVLIAGDEVARWVAIERLVLGPPRARRLPRARRRHELARVAARRAASARAARPPVGSPASGARSSRSRGRSASPRSSAGSPRSSTRLARVVRPRSTRAASTSASSSRRPSTTASGSCRGSSPGSGPPGSTSRRPTCPRSSTSSVGSATLPEPRPDRPSAEEASHASAHPRLRCRLSAAYRRLSCDSPAAHLGRAGRSPLTPCRRAPRRPWRRSPR